MTKHYDQIIIGAGPAGAGCGIRMRQLGMNPCVIDKAVFPRPKTCGGLITKKTYQLINALFAANPSAVDGLFLNPVSRVELFDRNNFLVQAGFNDVVRFADRSLFDHALVEQYKKTGGCLLEGTGILSVDPAAGTVRLADGEELHYDHLVFADGALSMAHRLFGIKREKLAFGIEVFPTEDVFPHDRIGLYFGYLENGYVWVFPHGAYTCIGLGGRYDKRIDYKKTLCGFLAAHHLDFSELSFHGAFLPYGGVISQNSLPDRILLVGDAGGFADPISGEGIYSALLSGIKAAEAMATQNPKSTYIKKMASFSSLIKEGTLVQKVFFHPVTQKKFIRHAAGNDRFVSFFFDNMVSTYQYRYSSMSQLLKDYRKS